MGSLVKEFRVFPTGDTFKPTETVNNISNGTSVTVNDPGPFYEAPPPNTDYTHCVYARIFWNVAGSISSASSVTVTVQGTTVVTCWYTHGCSPGGIGGISITTYAFDVDTNTTLAGVSPIGSVVPAALWSSPSTSVTVPTSGTATIDAKDTLNGKPFNKWLVFGSGSTNGDDVVIPANGGGFYIAFYKKPSSGGGTYEWGEVLEWLEHDWGFDFDEVVDPSPFDKLRLALLTAKFAQSGAPATGAQGVSGARQALVKVQAEMQKLAAREKSLKAQIDAGSKGP